MERLSIVHVAVDFAGDVPAGEHGLPVGDKLQHALRPFRDLARALGAYLLELRDAVRGLPASGHALRMDALVHRWRNVDPGRLVAPVIDANVMPGPRQVQIRVVRPLLAQFHEVGRAAPLAVPDTPAPVPERFPGLRIQQRLPFGAEALLRKRPHRQHDVHMGVADAVLLFMADRARMDRPVRREAARDELPGHEFARQRDILIQRKLRRQRDLELTGELPVLIPLELFDAVPKRLRSGTRLNSVALQKGLRPRRRAVRNGDFRVEYTELVDIAESFPGTLVMHARCAPVRGGIDRVPACPPRNYLCAQMVDRHAY